MSKAKISVERWTDCQGFDRVTLRRKRGGITFSDATEAIRDELGWDSGPYIVMLSPDITYQGYGDSLDESEGDELTLIDIGKSENCPICGMENAILRWCPECGTFIRGGGA